MRIFSRTQLTELLELIPAQGGKTAERDLAAVELLLQADLLIPELCGLVIGQVSSYGWLKDTLQVPAQPGRSSTSREVPLNQVAQSAIWRLLDDNKKQGFSQASAAPLLTNTRGFFLRPAVFEQILSGYQRESAQAA